MKSSRLALAVAAAITVGATTLGTLTPAQAQTATVTDPRGDTKPAIDVTAATFTNTGSLATVRLAIADLSWRGQFGVGMWTTDPEEAELWVGLAVHPDHTKTVTMMVQSRGGSWKGKCRVPDVTTQYIAKKDVVLVKVPRSCIPSIGRHPTVGFDVETFRQIKGRIFTDDVSAVVKHSH